jgi:hypothetical protein
MQFPLKYLPFPHLLKNVNVLFYEVKKRENCAENNLDFLLDYLFVLCENMRTTFGLRKRDC